MVHDDFLPFPSSSDTSGMPLMQQLRQTKKYHEHDNDSKAASANALERFGTSQFLANWPEAPCSTSLYAAE